MNWLRSKASEWATGKVMEIKFKVATDTAELLNHLHNVFIIVAIVGVYFILAGDKKTGTKITSISFFSYLILRSVISAYV